jgi:hypothetical protein
MLGSNPGMSKKMEETFFKPNYSTHGTNLTVLLTGQQVLYEGGTSGFKLSLRAIKTC